MRICLKTDMAAFMVIGYILCDWLFDIMEEQGFLSCDQLSEMWYINRICD